MNSDLTADGDWMGWRVARCQVVDKFSYSLEIRAYIGHDPHYFLAGVGFGGDNDRRSNIILSILTLMPTWPTNAAHFVLGCRLGKDATHLRESHTAANRGEKLSDVLFSFKEMLSH